jgi:hypothetical protein
MNLTLTEQERQAYITGDTLTASLLGIISDLEIERGELLDNISDLEIELEELK